MTEGRRSSRRAARRSPGRFSLGLQEVIEADLLDVGDPAQVVAAGQTLAEVHELLGAHHERLPLSASERDEPGDRVRAWLEKKGWA